MINIAHNPKIKELRPVSGPQAETGTDMSGRKTNRDRPHAGPRAGAVSFGLWRGHPFGGLGWPAFGSQQIPDSPAAFLESCRGYLALVGGLRSRVTLAAVVVP
jgi:hypothetical protein